MFLVKEQLVKSPSSRDKFICLRGEKKDTTKQNSKSEKRIKELEVRENWNQVRSELDGHHKKGKKKT